VTTAALALASLGAVGVITLAPGGTVARVGAAIAGAGALVLGIGLVVRLPAFVPWAVGLAGVGYVVGRAHEHAADGRAALVGGALLLAAELAAWSIDDDRRIREERALVVRRALAVTGLVAAATLAGFVFVGAGASAAASGLLLTAVGIAAALAAVAVLLRLLRA
jgi:trimeric autotransporter adhesin